MGGVIVGGGVDGKVGVPGIEVTVADSLSQENRDGSMHARDQPHVGSLIRTIFVGAMVASMRRVKLVLVATACIGCRLAALWCP